MNTGIRLKAFKALQSIMETHALRTHIEIMILMNDRLAPLPVFRVHLEHVVCGELAEDIFVIFRRFWFQFSWPDL